MNECRESYCGICGQTEGNCEHTKNRKLIKWNYEKEAYEDYFVPYDWTVTIYEDDMNSKINCAECGKRIEYGYSYTSKVIHNTFGFGYSVCLECYEVEKMFDEGRIICG